MATMYVNLVEVNQYLANHKLELTRAELDEEVNVRLEETIVDTLFGRLQGTYDVDGWVGSATTPPLVRSIIGMYMAGRIYLRQYGDQATQESSYGRMLITEADALVGSILEGDVVIADVTPTFTIGGLPETYDFIDPVFTMGEVF